MNLDPHAVFGDVLAGRLTEMAGDYQRIADEMRRLAGQVPRIGEKQGFGTITATGIATEALREVARSTPSPAGLVMAAADFEKHVPTA